jgi:hypothetical protein
MFIVFVSNSPGKNRFVSTQERRYIAAEVNRFQFQSRKVCVSDIFSVNIRATLTVGRNGHALLQAATSRTPWCAMLTSSAVWAIFGAGFSVNMLVQTLTVYVPTYFKTALKMDLKSVWFI